MPTSDIQPPQPPSVQRKLQFNPVQLIGVPLLALFPLLALLGVFGESFTTARVENSQLTMQLDYATRYRYKMTNDLEVAITNRSSQRPVTVTVAFERQYLDHFSALSFMPAPTRITAQAYEIELVNVGADETQLVSVELQGERYWQHSGVISASIVEGEPLQFRVETMIWP